LAACALVIALVLIFGLELGMARWRPPDAQNLVGPQGMASSFPARPVFLGTLAWTLFVLAVLPGLPSRLARFLVILGGVLLVIWIILAQLYFGLYYLSDILAGMAGGGGLALICWHMARRAPVVRS
jgi:undecaprenyl-diphosphatase